MKRPAGVVVSAIVTLLGALVVLGMCVLMASVFLMSRNQAPPLPPPAKFGLPLTAGMFLLFGAWGVATAAGLLLMRNWARISIIVFGALAAFLGFMTIPVMLLKPAPPNVPDNFGTVMRAIAAVYGAIALLGAAWVYYFSRRATREAFAGSGAMAERTRPLSVSIIGWWLLSASVISLPFMLALPLPAAIGVWLVYGWTAKLWYCLFMGAIGYAGYGVLKLKRRAWQITIVMLGLGAINAAVFYGLPGRESRLAAMMAASDQAFHLSQAPPTPTPPAVVLFITTFSVGVPLWFLFARREAFTR